MKRAEKNVCDIEGSSGLEKMWEGELNKVQEKRDKFEEMGRKKGEDCFRCGSNHFQSQCSFKNAKCHNCGKIGHISRKCPKSRERDKQKTFQNSNHVLEEESNESSDDLFHIYKNTNGKSKSLVVKVNLNGHLVELEVDTGASLTVISSRAFDIIKSGLEQVERSKSNVKLKTYSGEIIRAQGQAVNSIEYENQSLKCTLYIIEGDRPNLLGRDCLAKIRLKWVESFSMNSESKTNLDDLLHKFEDIFSGELGAKENEKAKIYLKPNSIPKFLKARPVPYALKNKIELEIGRMVKNNILEPVDVSEWATPTVPVIREDGSFEWSQSVGIIK